MIAHCVEIERCNQRGGRMLSVVDLMEARTLAPELAVYLLAAIGRGASFLVGAVPGGAGKTTVMGALLNFTAPARALAAVPDLESIGRFRQSTLSHCLIAHEIGPGHHYAYLWGAALRSYFKLAALGHQLAANLHADTLEDARGQICGQNGVSEEAFRKMNLLLFLQVAGGWPTRRRIVSVWESDGSDPHREIYGEDPFNARNGRLADAAACARADRMLRQVRRANIRTIEEVRECLVKHWDL
ncbi:MAG: hypothetical protein KA118_03640 [Verrucomicrobia bacterium]|nr:hypothetical protein [Verrucomicrobiota bacterium]